MADLANSEAVYRSFINWREPSSPLLRRLQAADDFLRRFRQLDSEAVTQICLQLDLNPSRVELEVRDFFNQSYSVLSRQAPRDRTAFQTLLEFIEGGNPRLATVYPHCHHWPGVDHAYRWPQNWNLWAITHAPVDRPWEAHFRDLPDLRWFPLLVGGAVFSGKRDWARVYYWLTQGRSAVENLDQPAPSLYRKALGDTLFADLAKMVGSSSRS